jgi:hypothetical protein
MARRWCLEGSGASREKLFMRAFNFFLLAFGLWLTGKRKKASAIFL